MSKNLYRIDLIENFSSIIRTYCLSSVFMLKLLKNHCGYMITFSSNSFIAYIELLYILYFIKTGRVSKRFFLFLHKLVARKLNTKYIGKFRKEKVEIIEDTKSRPDWRELNSLFNTFLKEYNENKKKMHPIEFVSWIHLKIVEMHPFKDGNGRVAVFLMNLVLLHYKYQVVLNFRSSLPLYKRYIKGVQKYISDDDMSDFIKIICKNILRNQILLIKTLKKQKIVPKF